MKKPILTLVFAFFIGSIFAQSIETIKNDKNYIYGEGSGVTLQEADQNALRFLLSQISTHVESKYEQNTEWGTGREYSEKISAVLKTYSSATLHNTQRIVVSNEPDAFVFRYIKLDDVKKIFEKRKNKAIDFVQSAIKAESTGKIADALKYYYWAFNLIKSHPDADEIYFTDAENQKRLLSTWIPVQMNNVFSEIRFTEKEIQNTEAGKTIILNVTYKKQPVSNLDYSFWEGSDWSNTVSAKDGVGFLDFYGAAAENLNEIKLKVEYLFKGEARIDKELEDVMEQIKSVPFRSSYINIRLGKPVQPKEETANNTSIKMINDIAKYESKLNLVMNAVKVKNYAGAKNQFTAEGYKMFTRLMQYGNARILVQPQWTAVAFNNSVMCRSATMSFSFRNNKQFVEDVVFRFNADNKIESVAFALSKTALNSIVEKEMWSENDRLVLVNFLEHYKTAYALERLDYIESIFDDNALIITGYFTFALDPENKYKKNKIVKYNQYSKQQYIDKLKYSFARKEYINLKFEESEVRKGGNANVYGVQIKQSYFSSNYGDTGYLFLMVDLNNPDKPIIHVRTWQPEKNEDGSIYGIGDF